jgi:hypothetical protein
MHADGQLTLFFLLDISHISQVYTMTSFPDEYVVGNKLNVVGAAAENVVAGNTAVSSSKSR